MKVFVTGVEGYIGSLLAPMLLERGHEVVGLDTGFYRDGWMFSEQKVNRRFPLMINKDLRLIDEADLEGVDAVVHLAELSNDPLGQNKPEITFAINHRGSVALAELAKRKGIERFVYTSSCSVYGAADGSGEMTEESATNPQTAYAQCKVMVERDLAALADDNFCPTFLRNATAYGASPRMRFDIVLNDLTALAWTQKRIAMISDGTPWRPLVHVLDICKAIICSLEAPRDAVHNQVFNVGHTEDNYQVRDIANIVADTISGCEVTFGAPSGDNRSYKVNFDKIYTQLPGFSCDWDARKGAEQLRDVYERIEMDEAGYQFRAFTRLKQLKYLIRTKQIDDEFFWRY